VIGPGVAAMHARHQTMQIAMSRNIAAGARNGNAAGHSLFHHMTASPPVS
jgi:hypothetical protein